MSKFHVGDRVLLHGEVTIEDEGGTDFISVALGDTHEFGVPIRLLTLIERKPKVGDKIEPEQFDNLPNGSAIVWDEGGGVSFKTLDSGWIDPVGRGCPVEDYGRGPYTIVYLPGQAA